MVVTGESAPDRRPAWGGVDALYRCQDDVPGFSGDVPVLIHVGLHKTGTTWLQDNILMPKDRREIICCSDFGLTHAAFIMANSGEFGVGRALELLKPLIDDAVAQRLPLVLTDEALGGYPFHHKYFREVQAVRMKSALPGAKILVTVRNQPNIILSIYGEYLKYGYSSRLEDFLAEPQHGNLHPVFDRDFYDYDRMLDLYGDLFGEENVLALPMEWMTRNSAAAMERIGKFLGVSLSPPDDVLARDRKNEAWTPSAREALRLLNHSVPQDSRWRHRRSWLGRKLAPAAIAWRVNRWSAALGQKGTFEKDFAYIQAELGDYYAASNRRFAERTGHDLAAFGYRMSQ